LARVGLKTATPSFVDTHVMPVGSGDAQPRPPERMGAVTAQQPSAGARVDQSTLVKLTVAR